MCRTEIITERKRCLLTGEYIGKSIERGHQGALIKTNFKGVTAATGLIADQLSINETRGFRFSNIMPGDVIRFKATVETTSCKCYDISNGACLSSLKSVRLLHPIYSTKQLIAV